MKAYFITFFSPGTLVAEHTEQLIAAWDVNLAMEMARKITERHGATPYGFQFSTRERKDNELDSKVTNTSNMYYLGGKIITLAQIKAQNDPKNEILIRNMECNKWDRIIENNNSWKWTQPLHEGDVVLEYKV